MPVRQTISYNYGMYFITFTCHQWIPLIEITNGYDIVYNWFDHLKEKGHFINGYVIMPNHVHILVSFVNTEQTINTIIGNGKRFMAYEIIERLYLQGETELLARLHNNVEPARKQNAKQHEVWELSFDWKECIGKDFIHQKLDYIHMNPCTKKWNLSENPFEYKHSSAKFYTIGEQGIYSVTNFMEMEDVDLSKGARE